MIAHHHDRAVAQHAGDALAFRLVVGNAAELHVIGAALVEPRGVLVDRLDLRILQAGQRRRIGHMRVQQAARMGQGGMDLAVDAPGRRVGRIGTVHRAVVIVSSSRRSLP